MELGVYFIFKVVLQNFTPQFFLLPAQVDAKFTIENGLVRAEIDSFGRITSLKVIGDDRDVFQPPPGVSSSQTLYGNQVRSGSVVCVDKFHCGRVNGVLCG